MEIDPSIEALLTDDPPPSPIDWGALEAATGCSRELFFERLAELHLVAAEREIAGHRATEKSARGGRRLAYCLGLKTPSPRRTRAEAILADARAFGMAA